MSETPETPTSVETPSVEPTSVEPVETPPVEPVETTPPLLRIVRGEPTPEEVAALVSVVSALAAAAGDGSTPRPRPEWSAPHRRVRGTHRHGPGAWRASAR